MENRLAGNCKRPLTSHCLVRALALCFLIAAGACSPKQPQSGLPADPPSLVADTVGKLPPFDVEIERVVYTEKSLHVFARVTPHCVLPAAEVALRLSGFKDGQKIGESIAALSQAALRTGKDEGLLNPQGDLEPDTPVTVHVSLAAELLSDFQFEVLWGDDALAVLRAAGTSPGVPAELRALSVSEEAEEACRSQNCAPRLLISGEILNSGQGPLNEVVLGVGYTLNSLAGQVDFWSRIPENEEQVRVTGLGLAPGASRAVRIRFRNPIPDLWRDKVTPRVRILSAN